MVDVESVTWTSTSIGKGYNKMCGTSTTVHALNNKRLFLILGKIFVEIIATVMKEDSWMRNNSEEKYMSFSFSPLKSKRVVL